MPIPEAVEITQGIELAGDIRVPRIPLVDGLRYLESTLEIVFSVVVSGNVLQKLTSRRQGSRENRRGRLGLLERGEIGHEPILDTAMLRSFLPVLIEIELMLVRRQKLEHIKIWTEVDQTHFNIMAYKGDLLVMHSASWL